MRKAVQVLSFFFLLAIGYRLVLSSIYAWEDVPTEDTYSGKAEDDGNFNPEKFGWDSVSASRDLYDAEIDASYDPGPKPYLGNIVNTPDSGPVCTPLRYRFQLNRTRDNVGLCGFSASSGQEVHAPYTCQYPWLVIYADEHAITLEVGTSDFAQWATGIFNGYVVHISNFAVDKDLLALYRQDNPNGYRSGRLPYVKPNDVIGTAIGDEVRVTVRDNGSFMDPRAKRDWWEVMDWSNCAQVLATRYGAIGISKKRSSDDYEITCQRITYASGPENPEMSTYTNKNSIPSPEMREEANFNLLSRSRAVHCGATKSQPLVLTETSPFNITDGIPDSICKDTWWSGEIQFNYNNETNNFRLPFAQEMADHWAGTLDAEHMKESDIDALFATAYGRPYSTPLPTPLSSIPPLPGNQPDWHCPGADCDKCSGGKMDEGWGWWNPGCKDFCAVASNCPKGQSQGPLTPCYGFGSPCTEGKTQCNQSTGYQEQVCGNDGCFRQTGRYCQPSQEETENTAKAAAEIKRRQGVLKALLPQETQDNLKCSFIRFVQKKLASNGGTLYKDFAIEGTKLVDIPCPPNSNTASPQYLAWQNTWGSKWAKMGLFPNERSIGDLRFDVCGSHTYYLSLDYPEMMRLGLATNELFKIFTSRDGLERYYLGYNDTQNMKLPVDKNPILTANLGASLPVESTLAKVETSPPPETPASSPELKINPPTIFDNLVSYLKQFLPQVKSALAQVIGKYRPAKPEAPKLLAQGGQCFSLGASISPHDNADGSKDVDFQLQLTGIAHKGGHLQIFANGSRATQLARILTPGGVITINSSDVGGPVHLGPGECAINFSVKIDECNELGNQEYYSCNVCTGECNVGTIPTPPGPGGPGENKCDTPTCTPSCSLCSKAQLFPSDNTLWPQSYPKGHMLIGTQWTGSGYSEGPGDAIHYNYTIPTWDGTYAGIEKVDGCQYKECREDDKNCARDYCFEGHGCGYITCTKVHDRVIDITNELPFAASIWRQGFETDNGIEKFCYNQCIKGKGKPADCKASCKIPSGFFNIFKPECDPSDPACPSFNAGTSTGLTGCTTDEQYVFDKEGDFGDNPGASYLTYTFSPTFGDQPRQFKSKDIEVTQKSPGINENAKVLFYRMGGMCNTNKWVTEKVLNPQSAGSVPESTGNMILTPLDGPCKGKVIYADRWYNKDTCEENTNPEPACCKNIASLYQENRNKGMSEDDAAHDANWTCDERDYCNPDHCPEPTQKRQNGWCGKFMLYFDRKGSWFATLH